MGRQVKGLKIVLIGFGRLGRMMHSFCLSFGADVSMYDPYVFPDQTEEYLKKILASADVVSLHVHVTEETKHMINKELLGYMKKNSYIVNTSRGDIVNEYDIVDALQTRHLSGYGTDVVEDEFNDLTKSPIIKAMNQGENIIITPHIGGMTIEGQTKAYKWSIDKL
tara:strand:- start:2 stop:499 length:498 start_codon:yes stop_codon:yes gene_type:complete